MLVAQGLPSLLFYCVYAIHITAVADALVVDPLLEERVWRFPFLPADIKADLLHTGWLAAKWKEEERTPSELILQSLLQLFVQDIMRTLARITYPTTNEKKWTSTRVVFDSLLRGSELTFGCNTLSSVEIRQVCTGASHPFTPSSR